MKGQTGAVRIVLQVFLIVILALGSSFGNLQRANDREQDGIELMTICGAEDDLQFLTHVAEFNMEEVLLGQLAQQKSKVFDIQELGRMMEETHSQSFIDLKELAKKKNLVIPTFPNHKARRNYKKLNKKSENDFDKAYCDLMVEDHKYAITLFEKELKKSADKEITKWAVPMLTKLRTHLTYSLNCQKKCENLFTDIRN